MTSNPSSTEEISQWLTSVIDDIMQTVSCDSVIFEMLTMYYNFQTKLSVDDIFMGHKCEECVLSASERSKGKGVCA